MRSKILIGALLLVAAVSVVTAVSATPRTAFVRFLRPTLVAGAAVMGAVVFEHDDEKMARGEPCTAVYYYDARKNAHGEKIVDFMCVPHERPLATQFEATVTRGGTYAGPDRLTEYQLPGEREGHGVPYFK